MYYLGAWTLRDCLWGVRLEVSGRGRGALLGHCRVHGLGFSSLGFGVIKS